ncbi:MAG: hypothetical protein Q7S15_01600 [bacterium]|nr:hypothetical protein [bacterium]
MEIETIKVKAVLPWLIAIIAIFFSIWGYLLADGAVISACAKSDGDIYLIGNGLKKTTVPKE